MATTFATRWILFVWLVNLSELFAAAGPPAPPSPPSTPRCHIPCDADNCLDIHCDWDPGLNTQIPTSYSLHWETDDHNEDNVMTGLNVSGKIHREKFSRYTQLSVWVQAKNDYGLANSQKIAINTGDIFKPLPPTITWSPQYPLEMSCNSTCKVPSVCLKSCDVRFRPAGEQDWVEVEIGLCDNYEFSDPLQPAVIYEFQVRCACCTGLMSEWGASHRIRSPQAAPVGQIDVWKDCGIFPMNPDCFLIWKKLPISQAQGDILRYEVRLSLINGTIVEVKVSTAAPKNQLVCDEKQCYLNYSLKNVSSASVSAHSSHGAISSSHLVIRVQGEEQYKKVIHLGMNTNNMTVSWNPSESLSNKEYVVQYKQAGRRLGQGIDWVRVNNSNAVFKGDFQKHTPYVVTLFTLSHNGESHHQSSVIGYSVQGTPPEVSSFQVIAIAATQVTLFWKPAPLSEQNGVILYYQIGISNQNVVYNVTASSWHENKTFELPGLRPEQEYRVWIRAVSVAGPGANVTISFNTEEIRVEKSVYLKGVLPSVLITIICLFCLLCVLGGAKACPQVSRCLNEKVPDPHNSRILKHMTHQFNDSSGCICTPICESQPKISVLEVVEIQATAGELFLKEPSHPDRLMNPVAGCSHADGHDEQREECDPTEHRYRREQYSKMVDSDEENDREDCWNSSAEEAFTSGYEKHFMPTTQEVMQC